MCLDVRFPPHAGRISRQAHVRAHLFRRLAHRPVPVLTPTPLLLQPPFVLTLDPAGLGVCQVWFLAPTQFQAGVGTAHGELEVAF